MLYIIVLKHALPRLVGQCPPHRRLTDWLVARSFFENLQNGRTNEEPSDFSPKIFSLFTLIDLVVVLCSLIVQFE